jgi:hypothetical protein
MLTSMVRFQPAILSRSLRASLQSSPWRYLAENMPLKACAAAVASTSICTAGCRPAHLGTDGIFL